MSSKPSAADLRAALHKWRPTDSGAFVILNEVRNGTGFSRAVDRTADAMIFGCWPSRGYTIEGVEIKVSRSDWLKELADPTKADALAKYCHRWWLVTIPGVVEAGELPEKWGMALLKRGVLRVESEPFHNETPTPLDPPMLASLVRNATRTASRDLERARHNGIAEGRKIATSDIDQKLDRLESMRIELSEALGGDPLQDRSLIHRIRIGLEAADRARAIESDERALRSIIRSAENIANSATKILGG